MATRQYSRQTLASYALFDNARRIGQPPQHALVPLVLPFLAGKAGALFSPEALATALQQIFGSNFTGYSAEALAKSLTSEGYLREDKGSGDGAVYFYTEKVNELNIEENVSQAENDLDIILSEFFEFLSATTPLIRLNYTTDEWKDLFVRWSTTVDVSDKDGLQAWVDGFIASGKRDSLKLDGNMEPEEKFFGIDKHVLVLFAAFTQWLSKNRSDIFAKVVTLAEIGFLIDLVSEIRDPVKSPPAKINLVVVLDGPVILDALGLMGPGRRLAADSMRDLCKRNGIRIIVLQHSLEEAREIVRAVLNKAAPARHGLVADTLRSDRLAERRAGNFLAKPDKMVGELGVQIVNANITSSYQSNQLFDDKLISDLAARLPYHDIGMNPRRTRDAQSVGFVMRRRGGFVTSDMFDARYVMLTRSVVLSKASGSFVTRNIEDYPSYAVPPAIEVRHFSTMFLLTFGTADGEKISRGELLSSCERVLKTSPQLIKKVRDTVEQLSLFTTEELDAVMTDPVALFEITAATGNDPEVVTIATAEALAKVIREAAAKDERIRHQKEARAVEQQHALALGSVVDEREKARLSAATASMVVQKNQTEAGLSADALVAEWTAIGRARWLAVVALFVLVSVIAAVEIVLDLSGAPLAIRIAVALCTLIVAGYSLSSRVIDKFSLMNLRSWIISKTIAAKSRNLPAGLLLDAIKERVEP